MTDRLGALSEGRLQDGLDRFGLGRLLRAEVAATGNFGQNVFLDTDRGRYVLRGNPLTPGQFAQESFFARVFHDHGAVPAPWPYHHESSADLFGWPYVIMGRLAGWQVADEQVYAALPPAGRTELARSLGATAAMISAVTGELAGHWNPETGAVEPLEPDWAGWVTATVLETLDRALAVSAEDRAWVVALLDDAADALAEPFAPVLLHGDYSRQNVTAAPVDGCWTVTGIYDLASAHYGHPDEELTRQFCSYLDHEPGLALPFLEAGLSGRPSFDRRRFRVLVVLERIMIWEWAKRAGAGWWPRQLPFRPWLERYLDAVPEGR
ncbi:phosphotransferase family protein [Microlunatus sp. GCM10028923]|uniref:phosphotransferase family protein n=1 Tax=Microlunatus sp. GCM10028923 TaxID=3273400 RepID=UPI00361B6856